jgi:hypothetical protein
VSLPHWPEQALPGEHLVHGATLVVDGTALVVMVFLATDVVADMARMALARDGTWRSPGLRIRALTADAARALAEEQHADFLARLEVVREQQRGANRRGKDVTG